MSGKEMTVEEIMAEVRQDKPYYEASGGGVTLSGGEVLCHLPFAIELAKACRKEGISVAIETNLSLPYEQIKPLLDEVDLVMADCKLFDEEAHTNYTGKSSATVKENLFRLTDIPLIVRTPLIPDVTATKENLLAIASLLVGKENLIYYQLLNFNHLGGTKYQSLDAENAFAHARPYTAEEMADFGAMLAGLPIKVKVGE
ncbi:MAG: radical SAM protein, partial [Clostridia bacterium]|nr:radical SAM protein [Clostridia bacterium]